MSVVGGGDHICIYIYIHVCVYIYIYIYRYRAASLLTKHLTIVIIVAQAFKGRPYYKFEGSMRKPYGLGLRVAPQVEGSCFQAPSLCARPNEAIWGDSQLQVLVRLRPAQHSHRRQSSIQLPLTTNLQAGCGPKEFADCGGFEFLDESILLRTPSAALNCSAFGLLLCISHSNNMHGFDLWHAPPNR